ncbi:MAG: winged helix-turn-helix domain-containing protein [Xanthomonadales bacterium]|nr:winged helix-turn-helix domain-containing protein [Xanthomonadales bacterium]
MIQFLDITVDASKRSVCKNGKKIRTSSLNFDMLVYFLGNPNEIISKEELKRNVWVDRVVSDNTVYKQIKRFKEELLVVCSDEELLQSVHGRGVVFTAEVTRISKSEDLSEGKNKPLTDKQSLLLKLSLLLVILVLVFVFFQINSIKQKSAKLSQKIERLAIVYQTDGNQVTTNHQRAIAQALKSQMLINDQLNVGLEKDSSDGETFKQISAALVHDLGYNHVLNMQIITHEYGIKALVYLRQEDYISPLKIFEVDGSYELVNKVSGWVFKQLQSGVSASITDMTSSESAFNDYLAAIRWNIENKSDLAIESLERAVEKDPEFFRAWNRLAGEYIKRGKVEKAVTVLNKIDLSQASDRLSFDVLGMRASSYFYLGNLSMASTTQDEALEYAKKLHDPMIQVIALVNQSYIYSAMFLPDEARKNLEEALLYVDKNYQKSILSKIYTGLFDIYNKSYDTVNALHYAQLAYKSAQSADNKRSTNVALSNWAGALVMNAEFDKAYAAAQKVVDYSEANTKEVLIGSAALILMTQVDLIYGRFKTARLKLDALEVKLRNFEYPPLIIEYLNFEHVYHLNSGNLSTAADFLEQSRTLTLEVENLDVRIHSVMLQVAYDLRTKQQNISIEPLLIYDQPMPYSPHLYAKAQVLAHNKQGKEAELQFEQSMRNYQKRGQKYILINAINAYLSFMLSNNNTSQQVSNWLNTLDSISAPPYPYLKHKALYQSLIGSNKSAAETMQQLKDRANDWWNTDDELTLLKYSELARTQTQP